MPYAKSRLGVDEGALGLLLLCLGLGSVLAMLAAGPLTARFGSRPVIVIGGAGMALLLPMLAIAPTPLTLGVALFGFGAFLGAMEVGMNIHAVEVEKAGGRPMMAGFHGLFSIGGFFGSTIMTLWLSASLGAAWGTAISALVMLVLLAVAYPRLLTHVHVEKAPLFVAPKGLVLLLAGLATITFLAEGAILDWSALLLTGTGLVNEAQGGLGYMVFAIAMTFGRLTGDWVTARLGDRQMMFWGGIIAVAGFIVLLLAPVAAVALLGFGLIGLGASNVVPVLFRQAGNQKDMPSGLAVAAITTTGYAGILVGPAGVGFVAHGIGLPSAFWIIAGLMCLVPVCAHIVTRARA